jgi:hypothetical protein
VDDLLTELERLAARRHPVVSWPQKIALTARTYEKKTDSSKLLKSFRDSMNGGGRGA